MIDFEHLPYLVKCIDSHKPLAIVIPRMEFLLDLLRIESELSGIKLFSRDIDEVQSLVFILASINNDFEATEIAGAVVKRSELGSCMLCLAHKKSGCGYWSRR